MIYLVALTLKMCYYSRLPCFFNMHSLKTRKHTECTHLYQRRKILKICHFNNIKCLEVLYPHPHLHHTL